MSSQSLSKSKYLRGLQCHKSLWPDDIAAKAMIDRIENLDKNSLPKDWDGSVALTSK